MNDLQSVLARKPLGLVFDIDGTLSPIVSVPAEARLYPGTLDLLRQAAVYAQVAILTGRGIEDGAAMVNLEGLTYIGSHGNEWSDGLPTTHPVTVSAEAVQHREAVSQLLDLAERNLGQLPGLLIERKRVGGAIHYRQTADQERTRQLLLEMLSEPARERQLLLREGKKVIEIKSASAMDKGRALRRLAEQWKLQGLLFAGDDRTDLDAVQELALLQQTGIAAVAIAVQHPDTPAGLLEQADLVVQGVPGMIQLLGTLVADLRRLAAGASN